MEIEKVARECARRVLLDAVSMPHETYQDIAEEHILTALRTAHAAGRREGLEVAATLIPANWCHPLLTGAGKAVSIPAGCPDIERLLYGIKTDILAARDEDDGAGR